MAERILTTQSNIVAFPSNIPTPPPIPNDAVKSDAGAAYISIPADASRSDGISYGKITASGVVEERSESAMDEGYKRLIDRLDQDIRDHKQEIRDRDARLQADAEQRENRYHDEAKEREERLIRLYDESLRRIDDQFNKHQKLIESKMETIDAKLDNVSGKIEHVQKQVDSIHEKNRFWINLVIPVLAAIIVGLLTTWATFAASGKPLF